MPQIKIWNGAWAKPKSIKVWDGASWKPRSSKYWNGSSWVPFLSYESWTDGAPMPTGRRIFAQVGFNGIIYAIGGLNSSSSSTARDTNEAYSTASNTWSTKTSMTYAQHGVRAAESGGKIYAIGGYPNSAYSNQMYDPSTNTWAQRTAMPNWADGLAVEKRSDGLIHAITGMRMLTRYTQHYLYNPGTNAWTTLTNIPSGRAYPSSAALGNDIYIIGGNPVSGVDNKVYKYSNSTNSWIEAASLSDAYNGFAAGGINGKVYSAGSNYEVYTPEANSWSNRGAAGVFDSGGMCVLDNKLYCMGGGSYSNQVKILPVS
ncbi:Kelch repeat-containing protein [Cohnella sp. GCM10020058]|uniref:Kelch repeat-containing protein n=1 Tax=Cohnella sp. GCM10020058 TaxID=3317330 RepID=UPI003625A9CE